MHILETLEARGFIQQSTDRAALTAALDAGQITFYVGFDPTGDSLHVGHLVPVMAMAWLQRAGHKPIVVLGGGTAMVGDPSGKDKTREILTPARIQHNLAGQRQQFLRFLNFEGDAAATMIDNGEWLLALNYVQFLRDIGKHFSVNRMLSAESARLRLERNQGLSFIEFNYHLLQSYDFLVLNRKFGCTLQVGGDDQWFNILGGIDLLRREESADGHALTVPLMATADGKKMGKTEKGAVWLDGGKLAPFEYYQYWVNVQDADVGRFLKLYTFLSLERIASLEALTGADVREAKAVLAWEATALAHGAEEADKAQAAAKALFSKGASSTDVPTYAATLPAPVLDLLVDAGLAASKGAARRLVKQGGCRIGDTKVTDADATMDAPGVLWAGKKRAVQITQAG